MSFEFYWKCLIHGIFFCVCDVGAICYVLSLLSSLMSFYVSMTKCRWSFEFFVILLMLVDWICLKMSRMLADVHWFLEKGCKLIKTFFCNIWCSITSSNWILKVKSYLIVIFKLRKLSFLYAWVKMAHEKWSNIK